jgi:hypothetical protein
MEGRMGDRMNDRIPPPWAELDCDPPPLEHTQRLRALPKVRAFAAGAAFVAEMVQVRSSAAADLGLGANTLNLEFAPLQTRPAMDRSQGERPSGRPTRRYDWQRKLVLQLTPQELVLFTATVLGWQSILELRFHGNAHDRGVLVRHNQDGGLFLSGNAPGRSLPVPLPPPERTALGLLCAKVHAANHPELSAGDALSLMRATLALRPPT